MEVITAIWSIALVLAIIIWAWVTRSIIISHFQKSGKNKFKKQKDQRINKNEKDILIDIYYSLKRIESNTSTVKWGIVAIVFLAFVLPIIGVFLTNQF